MGPMRNALKWTTANRRRRGRLPGCPSARLPAGLIPDCSRDSQVEASGEVGTMFNALKRLGIHGWRDMSQENITTQGMMQGVRDSDVFVLLLTTSTLSRWYCLLEIACALECGKPIVVVVEENPEFRAWDIERWRNDQCTRAADNQDRAQQSWHVSINLQTPYAKLEALRFEEQGLRRIGGRQIKQMIESHHADGRMIPHRRRGFEFDAMVRAVAARAVEEGAGWHLPPPVPVHAPGQPVRQVVVLRKQSDAGAAAASIAAEIEASLRAAGQEVQADVAGASHVVVVLTGGVLEDAPTLARLQEAITRRAAMDEGSRASFLLFVMSKADGWVFPGRDQAAGNATIEALHRLFGECEVMSCRRAGGPRDYEHRAMIREMLARMRVRAAPAVAEPPPPAPELAQQQSEVYVDSDGEGFHTAPASEHTAGAAASGGQATSGESKADSAESVASDAEATAAATAGGGAAGSPVTKKVQEAW